MIFSAVFVHLNGLAEYSLCASMKRRIASRSSPTLENVPRLSARRSSWANHPSTALKVGGRQTSKLQLKLFRRCIRKQNRCGLEFNLLLIGYDSSKAAEHIRSVQRADTVVLTYEPRQRGNRRWYATDGGRGGCRRPGPVGYECDEYPFFKTQEGGAYKPGVSLRWIPAKDNRIAGAHFGVLAKQMERNDEFVVITSDSLPSFSLAIDGKKK